MIFGAATHEECVMHKDYPECGASTGMRCAGQSILHCPLDVLTFFEHLRATAIPRALCGEVCKPLAPKKARKFADMASRKWVRFYAEHKKNKQTPIYGVSVYFHGDPYGNRTHVTAVKGPCLNRLTNGPSLVADVGFEPTTCRV